VKLSNDLMSVCVSAVVSVRERGHVGRLMSMYECEWNMECVSGLVNVCEWISECVR
jgi:hypothetical protein